jgi:uncharacterized protein
MSQENVDIVRRSLQAFARGDFDTAFAAHDPASEWCTAADEPDRQTYRGVEALKAFAASLAELWQDRFPDAMTFEEFIDAGDWVVAPWTATLHGRQSGASVDVSETYAVRVQAGRIVRVDEYRSKDEALEAVGTRLG